MKKLSLTDLSSIETYESQRPTIRQAIMEHKKTRRVPLGPNATLHFEDFRLMHYQVMELIRVEKITAEDDLLGELEAYNPLIPDGTNLKVTFMLEYPDEDERRVQLARLIDIENKILIQIGELDPVYPIANEDLPRSTEEKTSSVHFLRFEFTKEMISAARDGASWSIYCLHPNYQYSNNNLPAQVIASLVNDFD
ncbi:MAG: DUF3501 family protein [Gammaproteobacteria bacterium]|nr:DUF3501 family protein [Gammaproteobacteria bacterium]